MAVGPRTHGAFESTIAYGRQLVGSAIEGASTAVGGEPVNAALARAVRASWKVGALAAVAGFAASALRKRTSGIAMLNGIAGGAVVFSAGLLWSFRNVTAAAAHGAIAGVNAARDAHWLEQNPIDYA